MKKVLMFLIVTLVMVGCNDTSESSIEKDNKTDNEPTQEELNQKLKEEATEADFVKINGEEIEEGAKLKATGEISVYVEGDGLFGNDFTLTTDGGVYQIENVDTTETEIKKGQTVTVYGSYAGKNESGLPTIRVTLIE